VQIGGRSELAWAERRHQRRAERIVEHRRQEATLNDAHRVQELLASRERDLDRAGIGIDRD
jgi:hypothetical protein